MTNNQTGIGICGVVVGMIIGAGAIVYTQHYSVVAHLAGSIIGEEFLVAFRGIDPPLGSEYKRRSISVSNRTTNVSKIVTEPRYPLSPTKVQPTVVVDSKCAEKMRVVSQMREVAKRIIPTTYQYIQLSNQIAAALDSASQDCKPVVIQEQAMTSSAVTPVKPKPRVNNHCEQYDKQSQRYTRCLVNEREGQRYVGKQ
ncbi:hypothetical protein KKF55_04905 [Patescibacteria group bacterium]|nr:hypothetical protein [Patescibacteria group bacterium]